MSVYIFGTPLRGEVFGKYENQDEITNKPIRSLFWNKDNYQLSKVIYGINSDFVGLTANNEIIILKYNSNRIEKLEGRYSDITKGTYHYLATSLNKKKVFSWTYFSNGSSSYQLGHGNTTQYSIPTEISYFNNKKIKQILCSTSNTFVLLENGFLYGCGRNRNYSLGNYNSGPITQFQQIITNCKLIPEINFSEAMLYLNSNNNLMGFGSNEYYNLGNGYNQTTYSQQNCMNNVFLKKIILHSQSSLLLTTKGEIYSTGNSPFNGRNSKITSFMALNLPKIIDITCSSNTVVCLDEFGYIHCWGNDLPTSLRKSNSTINKTSFKMINSKIFLSLTGSFSCYFICPNKPYYSDMYHKRIVQNENLEKLLKEPKRITLLNSPFVDFNIDTLIQRKGKIMILCCNEKQIGLLQINNLGNKKEIEISEEQRFIEMTCLLQNKSPKKFLFSIKKIFFNENKDELYLILINQTNNLQLLRFSFSKNNNDLEYNEKEILNIGLLQNIINSEYFTNILFQSTQNELLLTTSDGKMFFLDVELKELIEFPLKTEIKIEKNNIILLGKEEEIFFILGNKGMFYLNKFGIIQKINEQNSYTTPFFISKNQSFLFHYGDMLYLILNQIELWKYDLKGKNWEVEPTNFPHGIDSFLIFGGKLFFISYNGLFEKLISTSDPKKTEIKLVNKKIKKFRSGNCLEYMITVKDKNNFLLQGKDLIDISFDVQRNNKIIKKKELKKTLKIDDQESSEKIIIQYKPTITGKYHLMVKINQLKKFTQAYEWVVSPSKPYINNYYFEEYPKLKKNICLSGFIFNKTLSFHMIFQDIFHNKIHAKKMSRKNIPIFKISELPNIQSKKELDLVKVEESDSEESDSEEYTSDSEEFNNELFYQVKKGQKLEDGRLKYDIKLPNVGFYQCSVLIQQTDLIMSPFMIEVLKGDSSDSINMNNKKITKNPDLSKTKKKNNSIKFEIEKEN
ncbi:hypothetical protein M0812_05487 [Anaeramoeba flamelloides]|uniref:Regulator of chromosome condensation n=1 Tax=Anaeramoeba flamelloides TaxID=1746091 RepID=A0AAV8A4V5_9EUKA|nr:hypothetical protein M0812_05487 [Anaeramoeba flamelloides]